MSNLVPPHGDRLFPLLVVNEELTEHTEEAKILLKVWVNSKEESDLIMLAMGAFSPPQGFMRKGDYQRVAEEIIRAADEMDIDLIAMSTHGRSGISRWAFGTVTDRVLWGGTSQCLW